MVAIVPVYDTTCRSICSQGAFRKVAAEADACAKQLTATLRDRLAGQAGDAAECIQLMRQLGEPVENLQVQCKAA